MLVDLSFLNPLIKGGLVSPGDLKEFAEWLNEPTQLAGRWTTPKTFAAAKNVPDNVARLLFIWSYRQGILISKYTIVCPYCHLTYGETGNIEEAMQRFTCDQGHAFTPADYAKIQYRLNPQVLCGSEVSAVRVR